MSNLKKFEKNIFEWCVKCKYFCDEEDRTLEVANKCFDCCRITLSINKPLLLKPINYKYNE